MRDSGRDVPLDRVGGAGLVAAVDAGADVDAQVLREGGVVLGQTVQRGGSARYRSACPNISRSPGARPGLGLAGMLALDPKTAAHTNASSHVGRSELTLTGDQRHVGRT
jgi:hypothetical protein